MSRSRSFVFFGTSFSNSKIEPRISTNKYEITYLLLLHLPSCRSVDGVS